MRQVFGGTPEAVAAARAFTRDALGAVPALDDVVLLVSELCSNAIRHTASGHGGTFEVAISVGRGGVQVSVRDEGSDQQPVVRPTEPCAAGGRGLQLVRELADSWGYRGDRAGRVVFFAVHWLVSRHLAQAATPTNWRRRPLAAPAAMTPRLGWEYHPDSRVGCWTRARSGGARGNGDQYL
jgi:serine/threonine-protein kinase RsbW